MYVCLITEARGQPVEPLLGTYRRRLQLAAGEAVVAHAEPGFTALVAPSSSRLRPLVAKRGCLVAIGNVRLTNANEVASWSHTGDRDASHLALVLSAVEQRGIKCIPAMLGDFAFVVWNRESGEAIAARDALGVRTMFVRVLPGATAIASLGWLLAKDSDYDLEFMADFLVGGNPQSTKTAWNDVDQVHGGHTVLVRDGRRPQLDCFWSPFAFRPAQRSTSPADVKSFGTLFASGVSNAMSANTWSELSGGLDSSSVVSLAKSLHMSGRSVWDILGTISIVDELGEGDERPYSDLVVRQYGVRNEQLKNYWAWQDDGVSPPLTDRPTMLYPFFARDRQLCELVRSVGAKVLLSGMGSDHYLWGTPSYFTDLLVSGNVLGTLREVASWAISQKQSVWHGLRRDVLQPVVARARWHLTGPSGRVVPPWIPPAFASRFAMAGRHWQERKNGFALRDRFVRDTAEGMLDLPAWLLREPYEDGFERRYPFLSRPLVEFALTLPLSLRMHQLEPKVVLREAMRGVLPEAIRRRQGKGGIDARIVWSLQHERNRIAELLQDPVLTQLGCVEPGPLRAAVDQSLGSHRPDYPTLLRALALETWLTVREGRWVTRECSTGKQFVDCGCGSTAYQGTMPEAGPIRSIEEVSRYGSQDVRGTGVV